LVWRRRIRRIRVKRGRATRARIEQPKTPLLFVFGVRLFLAGRLQPEVLQRHGGNGDVFFAHAIEDVERVVVDDGRRILGAAAATVDVFLRDAKVLNADTQGINAFEGFSVWADGNGQGISAVMLSLGRVVEGGRHLVADEQDGAVIEHDVGGQAR